MHAAVYGSSPAVLRQHVCPSMDLLESSSSLVPASTARKAVGTWATRRQFWVRIDGLFVVFLGTVGSGDQI